MVLLALQTALAPRAELLGARPDWLLVGVIYLGLFAPMREAVVASWLLGLCGDLLTVERFGLLSLTYVAAAASVASVREYVFRFHWLTQFAMVLTASLLVRALWAGYCAVVYGAAARRADGWTAEIVIGSLYTACWAPLWYQSVLTVRRWVNVPGAGVADAELGGMRRRRV